MGAEELLAMANCRDWNIKGSIFQIRVILHLSTARATQLLEKGAFIFSSKERDE
jgi:hypothetical protein